MVVVFRRLGSHRMSKSIIIAGWVIILVSCGGNFILQGCGRADKSLRRGSRKKCGRRLTFLPHLSTLHLPDTLPGTSIKITILTYQTTNDQRPLQYHRKGHQSRTTYLKSINLRCRTTSENPKYINGRKNGFSKIEELCWSWKCLDEQQIRKGKGVR